MREDHNERRAIAPTASSKRVGVVIPAFLVTNDRLVFLDVKGDQPASDAKGPDHG